MSVIVFRIFPQQSHHNATFKLANALKVRGHTIYYAGVEAMKSAIEQNNFDFYAIPEEEDMVNFPVQIKNNRKNIKDYIEETLASYRFFKDSYARIHSMDFFSKMLTDLKPDIILLDGTFKFFALQLTKSNIPYAFIETTVSTLKSVNIPPFSSSFVPWDSFLSKWVSRILWVEYHFPLRASFKQAFKKYCRDIQYPFFNVDFSRYFLPGFSSVPEINTSFKLFDYPREIPRHHKYYSPPVVEQRTDTGCDWRYYQEFEHMITSGDQLVLCSLGTMAWRYKHHEQFLRKLVRIFKDLKRIRLILCVDNDNLRRELHRKYIPNVHVFRKIPQLQLLPHLTFMIGHGGLNSISECILSEVPILVFPGGKFLDQRGNAGRVCYHKIGLKGRFTESEGSIRKKIINLLTVDTYKHNIKLLKERIQKSDRSEETLMFIESLIGGSNEKGNKSHY